MTPSDKPTESGGVVVSHDAHVVLANKTFRDVGYTIAAMQHKATEAETNALKAFNGLPPEWKHPFAWGYHPNPAVQLQWANTVRAHPSDGESK